jgi:uncharacterized protein (DUF2267 family)
MGLSFKQLAAEGESFIYELATHLNCRSNPQKARRILRASLHGVRNHLSVNESLQLIAQFPMFLKAIYVDGWKISTTKNKIRHMDDFIEEVKLIAGRTGEHDFPNNEEAENSINIVFLVLRRYISLGELKDIKSNLPKELKTLLNYDILI